MHALAAGLLLAALAITGQPALAGVHEFDFTVDARQRLQSTGTWIARGDWIQVTVPVNTLRIPIGYSFSERHWIWADLPVPQMVSYKPGEKVSAYGSQLTGFYGMLLPTGPEWLVEGTRRWDLVISIGGRVPYRYSKPYPIYAGFLNGPSDRRIDPPSSFWHFVDMPVDGVTVGSEGYLYLGFNDNDYSDNSGAFRVHVKVVRPDELENDLDKDGLADTLERDLAARFAPRYIFDAGEETYPCNVDALLSQFQGSLKLERHKPLWVNPKMWNSEAFPLGVRLADYMSRYCERFFPDDLRDELSRGDGNPTEELGHVMLQTDGLVYPGKAGFDVITDRRAYYRVYPAPKQPSDGRTLIEIQYWLYYTKEDGRNVGEPSRQGDWQLVRVLVSSRDSNGSTDWYPVGAWYGGFYNGGDRFVTFDEVPPYRFNWWHQLDVTQGPGLGHQHPVVYVSSNHHTAYHAKLSPSAQYFVGEECWAGPPSLQDPLGFVTYPVMGDGQLPLPPIGWVPPSEPVDLLASTPDKARGGGGEWTPDTDQLANLGEPSDPMIPWAAYEGTWGSIQGFFELSSGPPGPFYQTWRPWSDADYQALAGHGYLRRKGLPPACPTDFRIISRHAFLARFAAPLSTSALNPAWALVRRKSDNAPLAVQCTARARSVGAGSPRPVDDVVALVCLPTSTVQPADGTYRDPVPLLLQSSPTVSPATDYQLKIANNSLYDMRGVEVANKTSLYLPAPPVAPGVDSPPQGPPDLTLEYTTDPPTSSPRQWHAVPGIKAGQGVTWASGLGQSGRVQCWFRPCLAGTYRGSLQDEGDPLPPREYQIPFYYPLPTEYGPVTVDNHVAPATNVTATDDIFSGDHIQVAWTRSPDCAAGEQDVDSYELRRAEVPGGAPAPAASEANYAFAATFSPTQAAAFSDPPPHQQGMSYYFRILTRDRLGNVAWSAAGGPASGQAGDLRIYKVVPAPNAEEVYPPDRLQITFDVRGSAHVDPAWFQAAENTGTIGSQYFIVLEGHWDGTQTPVPGDLEWDATAPVVSGKTSLYFRPRSPLKFRGSINGEVSKYRLCVEDRLLGNQFGADIRWEFTPAQRDVWSPVIMESEPAANSVVGACEKVRLTIWDRGYWGVDFGATGDSASVVYEGSDRAFDTKDDVETLVAVDVKPPDWLDVYPNCQFNGRYRLRVRATDNGGNSSTRDVIFTVDRRMPRLYSSTPTGGGLLAPRQAVQMSIVAKYGLEQDLAKVAGSAHVQASGGDGNFGDGNQTEIEGEWALGAWDRVTIVEDGETYDADRAQLTFTPAADMPTDTIQLSFVATDKSGDSGWVYLTLRADAGPPAVASAGGPFLARPAPGNGREYSVPFNDPGGSNPLLVEAEGLEVVASGGDGRFDDGNEQQLDARWRILSQSEGDIVLGSAPPADDLYQVSVTLVDEVGNKLPQIFLMCRDRTPPPEPQWSVEPSATIGGLTETAICLTDEGWAGIDLAASAATAKLERSGGDGTFGDGNESPVDCTWPAVPPGTIQVTPAEPLPDETYRLSLTAKDRAGNATSFSRTFTVRASARLTAGLASGWNLVSAPSRPSGAGLASGGQADAASLPMIGWASQAYQTAVAPVDMQPGRGYWVFVTSDLSLWVDGPQDTGAEDPTVALSPGWNLVGHPLAFPVAVSDLKVRTGAVDVPLLGSGQTAVMPTILGFDGSGYAPVDVLEPMKAYWVVAGEAAQLVVPRTRTEASRAVAPASAPGEWEVTVQVTAEDATASAVLGLRAGAASGWDGFATEMPLPPAPPSQVQVSFPHPEFGAKLGSLALERFVADWRPTSSRPEEVVWRIAVQTQAGGPVGVQCDLAGLPASLTATLGEPDQAGQMPQNLRRSALVGFEAPEGAAERLYELRVVPIRTDAHLLLSMTPDQPSVRPGSKVTYTIGLLNRGAGAVGNLWVTSPLPTIASYVDASASDGGFYDANANRVVWNLGSLGLTDNWRSISYTAQVSADVPDRVTMPATVALDSPELPLAVTAEADVIVDANVGSEVPIRFPAGMSMVSIPGAPVDSDPKQIGFERDAWACWDPKAAAYVGYGADPGHLTWFDVPGKVPGRGFWGRFLAGRQTAIAGGPVPDNEEYAVTVDPGPSGGWVQIGCPRLVEVPWQRGDGGLKVRRGGQEKTLQEAGASGWCEEYAWGYLPGSGYVPVCDPSLPNVGARHSLEPWQGYWFRAQAPCELVVPAVTVQPTASAEPVPAADSGWSFAVQARVLGQPQARAVIGCAQQPLSLEEPPPAYGQTLQLRLVDTGRPLLVDLRAGSPGAHVWTLEAISSFPGAEVSLTWPDLSKVPKTCRPVLVDEATGKRVYMRTTEGYAFVLGPAGEARRLRIDVVGPASGLVITQASASARAGRSASLVFTLSAPATVTASVLNIAGRKVRTIVEDRACDAGATTLTFNGLSDLGTLVPSGRYLVRIQARADDGQQVSRLVAVGLRP